MHRLADQSSRYLRQHASNPVDWHPWDAEALAAALANLRHRQGRWHGRMEALGFEVGAVAFLVLHAGDVAAGQSQAQQGEGGDSEVHSL